jgi:hypothetical protein
MFPSMQLLIFCQTFHFLSQHVWAPVGHHQVSVSKERQAQHSRTDDKNKLCNFSVHYTTNLQERVTPKQSRVYQIVRNAAVEFVSV